MGVNYDGLEQVIIPDEKITKKDTPKKRSKEPKITLFSKIKDNPITEVRNLISVTETAMQDRVSVWKRYRLKYRRGLSYLKGTSSVPLQFTNYIFSTIETVKANMTRNLPLLTVSPIGARDDVAADLLTKVLADSLERGGIKRATRIVVHHGLIATMAYFKVYYSDIEDKLIVDAIEPEHMLVDPKATGLDNARWAIHKKCNVPIDEIYATYGVIPENDGDTASERNENIMSDRDGTYITLGEIQAAIDVAPTYDVYEAWIRCWEADRENDWYVVTLAGGTILKEEFSVYDHNSLPFVEWFANEDYQADNIYHRGVGFIEEIEPLQDRVDSLDLKITKHIALMSNRQRYISGNSGLNVNTMDNTAGRTYKVNGDPTKSVFYDAPPQMSQEVYAYRDRTELLMQTVSGVFDVTMGRKPTGITAGRAIESLKDSAETRLATVVDTLAEALAVVGDLALQVILQMYDGDRIIRSTDSDKDKDVLIVADYPENLKPQPAYELDEMGMPKLDENGSPIQLSPDTPDNSDSQDIDPMLQEARDLWKEQNKIGLVIADITYEWDIKANTDSALPSTKAERGQMASDLFRLGAVDRKALLDTLDFPDRAKILQRLTAEATGKNAGDPTVDTTTGQIDQIMQMLAQMGIPQEALDQIMQQVQGGGGQPQQTGNFPPQITM